MSELSDLSSFRCSAWCLDSAKFPIKGSLGYWPPTAFMENPPVKRFFAYPIKFKISVVTPSRGAATSPPPSSPPEDDSDDSDEGPSNRQRRRFSTSVPPRLGWTLAVDSGSASTVVPAQLFRRVRGPLPATHNLWSQWWLLFPKRSPWTA
jgi:hypothetical protein